MIDGIRYDTLEQALAAHKKNREAIYSKITPTERPIGGSAAIVLPSDLYIKNNFIRIKTARGEDPPQDHIDYFVALFSQVLRGEAETIEKRRIFDRVTIVITDNAEFISYSEDFILTVLKNENRRMQYFIRKKGSSVVKSVDPPPEGLPPLATINIWFENLEKTARSF
jgi:hypothetical protein